MALGHLPDVLSQAELDRLREAYDGASLVAANAEAFGRPYQRLAAWGPTVATLFYAPDPIPPRERELCMITLLAYRSPGLALANHLYWGLMEGLSVEQACQAIGLAGCYCGLPTYNESVFVVHRTLHVLKRLLAAGECAAKAVLAALVSEFSKVEL